MVWEPTCESRLQTAQLDLAMERWHRERQELDAPLEAAQQHRQDVIALRRRVMMV